MSNLSPTLRTILPPLSGAMSLLALGGGLYSLFNPYEGARAIGVAAAHDDSTALSFVSFVGARNISSGLTGLALLTAQQYRSYGLVLLAGAPCAWIDAWICAKSERAVHGKAFGHATMGFVVVLLGLGMWNVFD